VYSKRVSSLEFSGFSERTGPMSWPQHAIWSVIRWEGENAYQRNQHVVWRLPEDVTSQDVLDAFLELLRSCETLRTTCASKSSSTFTTRPLCWSWTRPAM